MCWNELLRGQKVTTGAVQDNDTVLPHLCHLPLVTNNCVLGYIIKRDLQVALYLLFNWFLQSFNHDALVFLLVTTLILLS